jgi:hypothetical protein
VLGGQSDGDGSSGRENGDDSDLDEAQSDAAGRMDRRSNSSQNDSSDDMSSSEEEEEASASKKRSRRELSTKAS